MAILIKHATNGRTVEHRTIGKLHPTLCEDHQLNQLAKDQLREIAERHVISDDTTGYTDMSYRQLQHECKKRGLKAVGKTAVLVNRLKRDDVGQLTDEDKPKHKSRNKTSAIIESGKSYGLTYRQAQKLVSYLKKQLPGISELSLPKNCGWTNVLQCIDILARTDAFRAVFGKRVFQKEVEALLELKCSTIWQELGVA